MNVLNKNTELTGKARITPTLCLIILYKHTPNANMIVNDKNGKRHFRGCSVIVKLAAIHNLHDQKRDISNEHDDAHPPSPAHQHNPKDNHSR